MSSTPCIFDDASLVMDEQLAMVETTESGSIFIVEDEDENKESVEEVGKIQQNFALMMCNTPSVLDDASAPTAVPVMIETTESESIVVVEEEEEEKERPKVTETVASNDGQNPEEESKAEEKEDESLEGAGKLIQDLLHSANTKVDAALDAFFLDFRKDGKQCERFVTAGGCLALVHLMQNCLDKVIARIPAYDQVTELNELAELTTLDKTLGVIVNLTFHHDESRVGIAAVGGVEAVVKVMKSFPKCQALQDHACGTLVNLAFCNIGKAKVIESGGIEVILAAITNHLNSSFICKRACKVLVKITSYSKENTRRLITLGGGAAVEKVRTKWPDNNDIQTQVRELLKCFAVEWKAMRARRKA
jgi:hypothetical protein